MSEVQNISLTRLLPDPDNVNQHNTLNISQIKASIQRFGFLDPIGVVKHPERRGYYVIVEGHGRFDASTELGLDNVPCIVMELTEAHRKGYAIAHNQTQQISKMDDKAVAAEFARLEVAPEDFVSLGYTQEDAMFLSATGGGATHSHFHAGDGEGEGETNTDSGNAASGFIPTVHRTSLTFASDASYNRFVHVLTQLRGRYPTAATIGERLILLLGDMGVTTPAEVVHGPA